MTEAEMSAAACVDPVWAAMRADAEAWARDESTLASWLHTVVLDQPALEDALAFLIAEKLGGRETSALSLYQSVHDVIAEDRAIIEAARADLAATYDRDPACTSYLEPFIFFKGYQALQAHRVAHRLWHTGRRIMAQYIQGRVSAIFHVDIHPAAKIGKGIMIDHAVGVVIGETAIVADGVSLLHGVTLGGTGKERGDRHPKIGPGTMIGANASILGAITVGACCRVGAGSVVLKDVPDNTTVAGVPARETGSAGCDQPAMAMNQKFW